MNDETTKPSTRSNLTLWLLLASFLIPAIAAYTYFFYGDRPSSGNNGQLISPIIDIRSFKLTDQNGTLLSKEELTPKWRMYYFVNADCDEICQSNLYNMRQINIALGKNQDRVQHVIVHLAQPENNLVKLIQKEHQQAITMFSKQENIVEFSRGEPDTDVNNLQSIYLVDPLGNVMMKFSKDLSPKLILKDLNKLLKISRIG